ncbi:hypothetical protein PIB30_075731 [Stylosanthes scabra]|uniref:Uncharacterized protein n=1 Tax=Stylosanthes scabra TaxID=79078 RepID=A0ABU6RQ12_9FABA|nr:hypothetical protein [Stylosanthes scabra]
MAARRVMPSKDYGAARERTPTHGSCLHRSTTARLPAVVHRIRILTSIASSQAARSRVASPNLTLRHSPTLSITTTHPSLHLSRRVFTLAYSEFSVEPLPLFGPLSYTVTLATSPSIVTAGSVLVSVPVAETCRRQQPCYCSSPSLNNTPDPRSAPPTYVYATSFTAPPPPPTIVSDIAFFTQLRLCKSTNNEDLLERERDHRSEHFGSGSADLPRSIDVRGSSPGSP